MARKQKNELIESFQEKNCFAASCNVWEQQLLHCYKREMIDLSPTGIDCKKNPTSLLMLIGRMSNGTGLFAYNKNKLFIH